MAASYIPVVRRQPRLFVSQDRRTNHFVLSATGDDRVVAGSTITMEQLIKLCAFRESIRRTNFHLRGRSDN